MLFVFLSYRPSCLPAVDQAAEFLPDPVGYLFPEQAEAQLSAKTQGTPTVMRVHCLHSNQECLIRIFSCTLAGVHAWAFSLCSCAICDSHQLFTCLNQLGTSLDFFNNKKSGFKSAIKMFFFFFYRPHIIHNQSMFFLISSAGKAGK